ncbi:g4969 [Coccomyxa elongata]
MKSKSPLQNSWHKLMKETPLRGSRISNGKRFPKGTHCAGAVTGTVRTESFAWQREAHTCVSASGTRTT